MCYILRGFTLPFNSTCSSAPSSPKLLPFDHVLPDPARLLDLPPKTAVLYATLDSPNFRELHSYLYAAARASTPHLTYVFRPIPPLPSDLAERTYLSGYGVALDLKKTDYLAVDDRLQSDGSHEEDSGAAVQDEEVDPIVTLLQQYPIDDSVDVTLPLAEEELHGESSLRVGVGNFRIPFEVHARALPWILKSLDYGGF